MPTASCEPVLVDSCALQPGGRRVGLGSQSGHRQRCRQVGAEPGGARL